jgi:hypothetical protein
MRKEEIYKMNRTAAREKSDRRKDRMNKEKEALLHWPLLAT